MKRSWLRHGFLNLIEHGVTRSADALSSLILLWTLAPEALSFLAIAQAKVAPVILLLVTPEMVIYRDYVKWKAEGTDPLATRIRALRLFGWSKAAASIVLSVPLAALGGWQTGKFFALIWAFFLVLAPQISGPDRELMRIDLRMRALNLLNLWQKLSLLLGTVGAAWFFGGKVEALAGVAVLSAVSTAILGWRVNRASLLKLGASEAGLAGKGGIPAAQVIAESIRSYSAWNHLTGTTAYWISTMDVFFLGTLGLPARVTGLYATCLKLANFANALPMALSNVFAIWLGRRDGDEKRREVSEMRRLTGWLLLGTALQAALIYVVSPWILELLSHSRWTGEEREQMRLWLGWILAANVLLCGSYLATAWLGLRGFIRSLFFRWALPWAAVSLAVYAAAVHWGGPDGAARGNLVVAAVCLGLLIGFFKKDFWAKTAKTG